MNEYFTALEPIISSYNGVINKFIGDAVMAIFGEPIQDINHPQNAVKCAYEMLKKVEYLREKWLYEGKPKIEIGVGINTGEVFIGNIGTENRMEYTVIGDTVNLASRIESYNKVYKTNLLVSSSTYASIADIADVIKISEVQIRGKAKKAMFAAKAVKEMAKELSGDEKTGAEIVLKALEAPLYHIAANAGLEGSVIINKVAESEVGMGFDALTETYVNMVESGIIDPAKVTRSALQNATSVASTLLTTESVVADIKEDTPAPAMPAGGMGMM